MLKRNTGRVGIGNLSPDYALDVSGSLRVFNSGDSYAGVYVGTSTVGVFMQGNISNGTSYIRSPGGALYIGGGNTGDSTVYILNNRVGINTTDTTYALNVTAGATSTAAVNMSTWPRMGSTCLLVKGVAQDTPKGNTIALNAATQSIDTNLATFVANDATNGNSLYILKAGIWSLSFYVPTNNNTAAVWIDASTNNNNSIGAGIAGNPVVAFFQGPFQLTGASYTGYLTSNTFYKLRMTATAVRDIALLRFSATFHGEVNFTSTYPF
jgi:hypothetical protein